MSEQLKPVIRDKEDALKLVSNLLLLLEEASSDLSDVLHSYAVGVKSGDNYIQLGTKKYTYSELLDLVFQNEK